MAFQSRRSLARFTAVMVLVAGADLLTKQIATLALRGGSVPIAGPFDLALTRNLGSAFGISLGAYTWPVNAIATLLALGLAAAAVRSLSTIDRLAPVGLGLIAGAAIGNLTSMLVPPAGVTDFLSVRVSESARLVMNLADVAAYAGLALAARSAVLLSRAIGVHRTVRPAALHDVEIPIPLAVERAIEPPAAGREHPAGVPAHIRSARQSPAERRW